MTTFDDDIDNTNLSEDDSLISDDRYDSKKSFTQRYMTRNMLSVIILGVSFCTFFTAFNTTQGFITSIKKDVGFWSLAVLYFFFAVFNLFSPAVVARTGPLVALILGAVTYSIFVLACCFNNSPLLIAAAVLIGWGASTLWTAHGQFLTDIAGSDLGLYSGIFFAIFQTSGIVGNVITGILFGLDVSVFWVFFILFIISIVGVGMLLFLIVGYV
jgi:MFS family permease